MSLVFTPRQRGKVEVRNKGLVKTESTHLARLFTSHALLDRVIPTALTNDPSRIVKGVNDQVGVKCTFRVGLKVGGFEVWQWERPRSFCVEV